MKDRPKKSGRGGYRPGAGRKPISTDELTESITVTLPTSYIARLSNFGDGNVSLGIRRLVSDCLADDNTTRQASDNMSD